MFFECIQKALGKEKCLPSAKKKTLAKEFFAECKKIHLAKNCLPSAKKIVPGKSHVCLVPEKMQSANAWIM